MALRELRKQRGLSQETLAFESGYHPTYIGQLERGKKSPSLRTIVSIATVAQQSFMRSTKMWPRVVADAIKSSCT